MKDRHLAAKLSEYLKRIQFEAKVELITVKDSSREAEGERIMLALDRFKRARIYALTEEGKQFSSREFAEEIGGVAGDMVFVIGGPDGLAAAVRQRADATLSLSRMTFPHEMAATLLAEQIFRALTILGGRSYHK